MKILITGGAGFIGSNLVYRLVKKGENHITVIDNLCTGNILNIEDLIISKRISFINKNICDDDIVKIIKDNRYDCIYNLACPASPKYYLKHPIETWETCVLGVRNILNGIKETDTKLLHSSTSEVYGSAIKNPQDEFYWGNVNCIGVRACYDEGKRSAETLIFDFQRIYNVNAKVIRIFNTYGPMMNKNDGRIISNFINQAIENKNITIYGTGEQTRSFCYIDDTIDAIIKFMEKREKIDFPINIGNPTETKVKEVANIIKQLTNSKSEIIYCSPMKDDPPRRQPNISNAVYNLDWQPKISLEEGLKKCINYYKTIEK